MTWEERYKRMVQHYGWTAEEVAELTGNTPGNVRNVTSKNKPFPRWLQLAVLIFEKETGIIEFISEWEKEREHSLRSIIQEQKKLDAERRKEAIKGKFTRQKAVKILKDAGLWPATGGKETVLMDTFFFRTITGELVAVTPKGVERENRSEK